MQKKTNRQAEPSVDEGSGESIDLSVAEEQSLVQRMREGDASARYWLMLTYVPLVDTVARTFVGSGLTLRQLMAAGNFGLSRAADKFETKNGQRFFTYAEYWIIRAIRHAIARQQTPKLPPSPGSQGRSQHDRSA